MGSLHRARNVAALIAASAAALLVAPAAFPTSLAGYWNLDAGKGSVAADSSGNANTGSVIGGARWVSGKFRSGLQFDGVDDAMQVLGTSPNFSVLEPASVSVEAWVKRNGTPGPGKHIIAKGDNNCFAASYALYTGASGGLSFYVQGFLDGGSFFVPSPEFGSGVWDGNWHHVAGTFDGFNVRLYVDGVEVGTGTPSFFFPIGYGSFPSTDLLAGMYNDCGGALNFDGAVDELRIWSRALGADEIAASAAMGVDAADELGQQSSAGETVLFTSHFKTPGGPIVISLESTSGLRTISEVRLEASKKGTFSCGGTPCPISLSNGGRSASLTVAGAAGASGRVRVTLDNSSTFAVNVSLR
jgi:hypothetical protein